jgi:hypothetical protein
METPVQDCCHCRAVVIAASGKGKSERSKTPWRHTVNERRLHRAKMARLADPTFEVAIARRGMTRGLMVHSTQQKDAVAAFSLNSLWVRRSRQAERLWG